LYNTLFNAPTAHPESREGQNLPEVLDAASISDATATLRAHCNNGETAANGEPDFAGLRIGDYLDGLDLPAIPAENGGTPGRAWNDAYRNNRIVIAGFTRRWAVTPFVIYTYYALCAAGPPVYTGISAIEIRGSVIEIPPPKTGNRVP
jgi:hypothetical protein